MGEGPCNEELHRSPHGVAGHRPISTDQATRYQSRAAGSCRRTPAYTDPARLGDPRACPDLPIPNARTPAWHRSSCEKEARAASSRSVWCSSIERRPVHLPSVPDPRPSFCHGENAYRTEPPGCTRTAYTDPHYRAARSACSFSALLLRSDGPGAAATRHPFVSYCEKATAHLRTAP